MARFFKQLMFLAVLTAALAACKGHSQNGLFSHGDLYTNGTGISDVVALGGQQLYVLRNIKAGGNYTLRTQIAPGATLRMDVYKSEADFNNGMAPITPAEAPLYVTSPYDTTVEVVFNSGTTSGDYALVMNGVAAGTGFDALFFQDLRLMSSTDNVKTFATASVTATYTSTTMALGAGSVHVYDSITSSIPTGTYTISLYSMLASTITPTVSYPQLFVYGDNSLTIRSLLYSITSNTTEFIISTLTTSVTGTIYSKGTTTGSSSSAVISNVQFTSDGPFILLKGVVQANYDLTVGP